MTDEATPDDATEPTATERVTRRRDRDRRRRERPRRSRAQDDAPPDSRGPLSVVIVAAAAIALVALGSLLPRGTTIEPVAAAQEPVDSSTTVCPEPGAVDGAVTTSTVTVVPGLEGQDRPGAAEVTYLRGPDETERSEPEVVITAPGDSGQVVADARRLPPLTARTTGSLAPGLVSTESTLDTSDSGRGLSSTACLGPDTSWWFVGSGSTAGRESNLVLVNPESTPAELDVAIFGPEGPLVTPALRGLVLEANARTVVRLTREAPRLPAAAWHVSVRSGRVVAAVQDTEIEGYIPRGDDWIPPAADPSTRVLVPGIMPGRSDRQLIVLAPGEADATVRVRLVTEGGSYVPTALSQIDVPAGTVVTASLTEALDGQPATLELSSDEPIVAGVRQRHSGVGATDFALDEVSFTAGAVPLSTVAAVTGLPTAAGAGVTLWITAPGEPLLAPGTAAPMPSGMAGEDDTAGPSAMTMTPSADDTGGGAADDTAAPAGGAAGSRTPVRVTVQVLPEGGTPLEPIAVEVLPGRLVEVRIPRPRGAEWFTAVVRPEGGEVLIAHRVAVRDPSGALVSGFPWRPLRTTVGVLPAGEDIGIAVPPAP
ncbi:MAG: DUF5719 family protein [bacterium]